VPVDDIVLSQEQFRLLEPGDGSWKVPVLYRTPNGDGRVLVDEEPVVVEGADSIIVNAGGEGFYRVAYSEDLQPAVLDGLVELPAIERFAIVSDAVANMLKGDLSGAEYLSLAAMLGDENDKDVWSVALSGISELDRVILPDGRLVLQDYVTGLVSPKAGELGWYPVDGESDRTRSMRNLLLKALGNLGEDAETIDTARSIYAADDAPDAEIADAALGIVAAHGDAGTFGELIAKSDDASTPQLKVKYLRSATQVADPTRHGGSLPWCSMATSAHRTRTGCLRCCSVTVRTARSSGISSQRTGRQRSLRCRLRTAAGCSTSSTSVRARRCGIDPGVVRRPYDHGWRDVHEPATRAPRGTCRPAKPRIARTCTGSR